MKRSLQALTGLAALLALVGMLYWQDDAAPVPVMASPGTLPKAQKLAERPPVADRFAAAQVLESKDTVWKDSAGISHLRRVRLIRDASFKYPLLRVEDDWVRLPEGQKMVRQVAMVGDHVLVKLRDPKLPEAELLRRIGDGSAMIRKKMPASGIWLIAFAEPKLDTVPRAMASLSKLKDQVLLVEPDHVMSVQATPNDGSFSQLWGLHNTGQSGGLVDADVDAPEAWDISTGSRSVVVAVIDTGIDQTHPDLVGNLWTNPDEIAANGIDDDGNGYVDDVHGWDWVNADNHPNDDNGHGSHCAGIIGALGNNGSGAAGVCWQVSLLGLKFLNASGSGFESDGAEAIAYATHMGVSVTSNSYTGPVFSQAMKEVIDAADAAGILFVAAAGNNASNIDASPEYPAAYDSANILSVTASTRTDELAGFSNFGATNVDLAAPGHEIYSTLHNGAYGYKSGTSMAAPHVAGAIALLKSLHPALTATEIRELIVSTVNPLPALSGKCVSGGRLNLYNALLASGDVLATPTGALTFSGPIGGPFTPATQTLTLTNHGSTAQPWTLSTSAAWLMLSATSGTLSPGGDESIQVSLSPVASQLLATTHTASLTITSTGSGRVQSRPVHLQVAAAPVFSTRLDSDPGWSRTGEWAYGVPQGGGAVTFGNPDPSSGFTGAHVFGINLAGDYAVNSTVPQFLTAGPFDLANKHATKLRYQRWLNADFQPWVITNVQVSTDQMNWSTVWENNLNTPRETDWTAVEHDLAALADGHAQVWVRWGHTVASTDAYAQSGWNLDDLEILAVPDRQLRLLLPVALTEGGAAQVGSVMVAPAPAEDLVIQLSSSQPGQEASFPASLLIPAGQNHVSFEVLPVNDTRVDGSQLVVFTASAAGWPLSELALLVHDNETARLTLALPASVIEGQAPVADQARVSLPEAAETDITIQLASGDSSELEVPVSVVIPAGQSQAFFTLTMPEDDDIEGIQSIMVTASVTNWPSSAASIELFDNESRQFVVQVTSPTSESSALVPAGGRVSLSGILLEPLVVSLSSSDATELAVPSSITIPAGASQALFDLTLVNDDLSDGDQSVTVAAEAVGFISASAVMVVTDDEQPALPDQPTPQHQQSPTHPETDLAWSFNPATGGAPESYEVLFGTQPVPSEMIGTVTSPNLSLPRLEPGAVYHWQVIARRGAQSRSGPVWSFTVPPVGPLHHFGWSDVPSAVARGSAFTSRVTAFDAWDNEITDFAGSVSFSAGAQPAPTTSGTGSFAWFYPLACYYHDARMQSLYPPAEVGAAGRLVSLALDVVKLPGQLLKDFTIRLKHTSRAQYTSGDRNWETAGWVTVFSGNVTLSSLGWNTFTFTTPFDYDGTQNLMVDVSFNNNDYSSDGTVRSTITTSSRTLIFRTDSANGDPLEWSGTTPGGTTSNVVPNLRFTRAVASLPMTPAASTTFSRGSWNGSLTVLAAAEDALLKAELAVDPQIQGSSSMLDVVAVNDLVLAAEPLYTGGTLNTVSWNSLGAGYEYEVQRATSGNFSDAVSTDFITATQQTYTGLADGQLYHYRARARASGLTGAWSEPQRSTQDATAPVLVLTPLSGGLVLDGQITLQGTAQDLSGISSLTVNGGGVNTANAFATWNQPLLSLQEGPNTFTLEVEDHAVPPNRRTEIWNVFHLSSEEADADGNGLGALLDYALHGQSAGLGALPQSHARAHPLTGQPHLHFSYRRRLLNPSGVQYHLETSSGLTSWQPAGAEVEEVSSEPAGDGITETVTVRFVSPIPPDGQQFIRLRVQLP